MKNFTHNILRPLGVKHRKLYSVKGCVRYIFASLFFKSKQEHLSN